MVLTQKPEEWSDAKKELADPTRFVEGLKRFNHTSVPKKNVKRCKAIIAEFDLTAERVGNVSRPA